MKLSFQLFSQLLTLSAVMLVLQLPAVSVAQNDFRRPLEHEDYAKWNSVSGQSLSQDGNWIMYSLRDGEENSTMHFRNAKSAKQYEIANGSGGRFSYDSQYAAFRVSPDADLLKKLKKEKRKPEEMPQTKLQILHLKSGDLSTVERSRSFSMPEENSDWIAILLEKPFEDKTVKETKSTVNESYEVTEEGLQRPIKKKVYKNEIEEAQKKEAKEKEAKQKEAAKKSGDEKEEDESADKKDKKDKKEKSAGTTLILRNLKTGAEQRIPNVVRYSFSKQGAFLAFAVSTEDEPEQDGVYVINLEKDSRSQIVSGLGNFQSLTFSEDEKQLAFMTDKDDYDSKDSSMSLYHWKAGQKTAAKIVDAATKGVPEGWWLASGGLTFSEDGRRLFFNTKPIPEDANQEEEDDEDKEPVAKLDLWHWKDPQLQPQQLLQASQERNRSYRAVFDVKSKKVTQLANLERPSVSVDMKSTADMGLSVTNMRYRKVMSWDFPGFQDTYLVDLKTGEATMILETARQGGVLSPDAKYVTWWDAEKEAYFAVSTKPGSEPVEISQGIEVSLANELHDTPSPVRAYGGPGWTTDDAAMLVYDRFDIWQLDPTGKEAPVCLTENFGRENNLRLRYVRTDREARHIDVDGALMLSAFNEKTKASGYYRMNPVEVASDEKSKKTKSAKNEANADAEETGDEEAKAEVADSRLQKLIMLDERVGSLNKARQADAILFTRSTFQRFPDVWYSSMDFKKIQRISNANPQQSDYNWGTVEMVHWDATDGQKLDGLLYKPDNFDPEKKYPLMVYFYERNSDNLHSYHAPAAGRSIINFSFYVSRGYVVFIPDIPYKTGEPGPSAANAVLPGVESIVEMGFIDEEKIGMQGHSWGGYQTAYLVTQTDMFACAESGAPVSNMTSAYGGIRWGSGMSRMFQYERTQSRIGEDLWSAREKYLANSPVFFADKINTPLLILHNDEDGAVPWYQGIELFVAMRRLEKPAWLMNYNGEPHWVMKDENRLDFAIRMQQFFDHYLMDEPMPEWMATGIPAVDKGKRMGYEPAKVQPGESSEESAESEEETVEVGENSEGN